MGYASALMDLDNDGQMDWFVGAPTAGSGQDGDFAEQAGWIGWFELRQSRGFYVKSGWAQRISNTYGWSLALQQSDTKRSIVFAGAPGVSTVLNTICFQQVEEIMMYYMLATFVVWVGIHVIQYRKGLFGYMERSSDPNRVQVPQF